MAFGLGRSGALRASRANTTTVTSSGITAKPNTLFQPKPAASTGASNAAKTVPELPAPAMPIALPWCCGGYHCEASGSDTANEAPATPRNTPSSRACS
ncbi:hypothetical protein D3C81_2038280 [compost metagenome]